MISALVLALCAIAACAVVGTEERPAPGGTYSEAVVGQPLSLNPVLHPEDPIVQDVARLVFAGLVRVTDGGRISGDLATAWSTSDDGRTYTFALNPRAFWHDGQPVTSVDVLATVALLQAPAYGGPRETGDLWRRVRTEAPDLWTVRFMLPEPFAPFIEACSVPLLPAHVFGTDGSADLSTHPSSYAPVGAGPFAVGSMDDSGLTLVRHQAFHGRRPLLDQIGLRFYPDAASATLALAAGEVDGFAGLTHAEVNRPADGEPLTVRESPLQAHQTLLSINHRDPVLSDPAVRRAIALTVNREALVQGPLAGQAVPAYGPVPAYSWAYERAVEAPADPARAQRLLDEAGWVGAPVRARNGRSLRLRLLVPAEDRLIAVATALAGQLQPLGIETDVQPTETLSLYREHLMARNYALALYGVWLGTIDPDPWALWHSSQREDGFNFASYSNPRADEALARARATADPSQRFAALSAFQQLWLEDVPSLSLYSPLMFVATPADLLGVRLGITPEPSARFQHLDEWHLHTQRVPLFAR